MFSKNDLPDITEREQAFQLHKAWEELSDRAYQMETGDLDSDPEALRLDIAKAEEAEEAYRACGVYLLTDPKGNAIRCAVSGAPILESDEIEIVLRVAVMEEVA